MRKVINIALMAHVDAGKTTLTEQVLYQSGTIRKLGSVDEGTARTDDLSVERQRGISVRAAFTSINYNGVLINLIDTPGHADFYSQAERAFLAVDAVVVLVSAVDGIQSGTENIIAQARESGVPIIFFINKCDRDIARTDEIFIQIKEAVSGAFDYIHERYETAATHCDDIMSSFLNDETENAAKSDAVIFDKFRDCEIYPIFKGSAYTGEGVDLLMNFISGTAPSKILDNSANQATGVVFSVTHDKMFGRGAYIRLFSGQLAVRDIISINKNECKVSIIKQQSDGRWEDAKSFHCGDIALVYGLSDCKTGDVFGDRSLMPERSLSGLTAKALLTVQVSPENAADNSELRAALELLAAEDPLLELVWEPISAQLHINVMGVIQTEILAAIIAERFGIKVKIGEPVVIYKETLARPAIGFDAYTMPKPSWAVLKFEMTPAKRGNGITYECTAAPKLISYRYRGQVELSILPSLKQGLYGWEVTDMHIHLVDGEDHPIHTHPLDFTIATPLALMDGLRNGGTILLEPVMSVRFTFEAVHLGKIMSDIIKMRGKTEPPEYRGTNIVLHAKVPLASSLEYPVSFASITSGHGVMTQRLHGYEECPLELGKTCPRRGVDPLERSKYILAARHAMAGTVFSV